MKKMYKGFTLAEVLITLGIIGVVAALTIPTLLQKADEAATVSALKKSYSTISNAYSQAVYELGPSENWGASLWDIGYVFLSYFNAKKTCKQFNTGCTPGLYKNVYGVSYNFSDNDSTAILNDGSLLFLDFQSKKCTDYNGSGWLASVCGYAYVDVNGYKKPNIFGKDLFIFNITKNGVVPDASPTSSKLFSDCVNGGYCTAWVIMNGNMDYLHCPSELSWTGKTKCD